MNTTRLTLPPPTDNEEVYQLGENTAYRVGRFLVPALNVLRGLPVQDRLGLVDVSDEDVAAYVEAKVARHCRQALHYLKAYTWYWRETGAEVEMDKDFLADNLGQDVTLQTVHRRLKERRVTLPEVYQIIDFFESELVYTNEPDMMEAV